MLDFTTALREASGAVERTHRSSRIFMYVQRGSSEDGP